MPIEFHIFTQLPIELRRVIWTFSLPDDVSELCIWDPIFRLAPSIFREIGQYSHRGEENEANTAPSGYVDENNPLNCPGHLVLIGIPTIMHVCQESRGVAQRNLLFTPIAAKADALRVPCRRFRPQLDVLYVAPSAIRAFVQTIIMINNHGLGILPNGIVLDTPAEERAAIHSQYRHLALPASAVPGDIERLICDEIGTFHELGEISVVFEPASQDHLPDDFHAPSGKLRHMRLDALHVGRHEKHCGGDYCPRNVALCTESVDKMQRRAHRSLGFIPHKVYVSSHKLVPATL